MPEVVAGGNARAEPRDRNPVMQRANNEVTSGAAARVDTNDSTYTVPAGKKAILFCGRVATENRSTTPLNARASTRVSYTKSGSSGAVLARADVQVGEASVSRESHAPAQIEMLAGDDVKLASVSDNSAAGSDVRHQSDLLAMEFDA